MHFRAVAVFAAAFDGFTLLLDKAGVCHAVVDINRAVVDNMTVAAQLAKGVGVAGIDINRTIVFDDGIGFGVGFQLHCYHAGITGSFCSQINYAVVYHFCAAGS